MKLLIFISSFSFALTIFVLAERTPEEFWTYVFFSLIISFVICLVVYSNTDKWFDKRNKKYDLIFEDVESKVKRIKSDIIVNKKSHEKAHQNHQWNIVRNNNKINELESKFKYFETSEFTDEIIKKINNKQLNK